MILIKTLWWGQEEVVVTVVEGRSRPEEVGIITVFGATAGLVFSNSDHQVDTKEFAFDFFDYVYYPLLLDLDTDELAFDTALTEQGRVRIDAVSGVWVIGPGTTHYSLSTWQPGKPFLMTAVQHGRANFVE